MSKANTEQQTDAQPRGKRLSPELNELMHMLNALEGQLTVKPAPATTTR